MAAGPAEEQGKRVIWQLRLVPGPLPTRVPPKEWLPVRMSDVGNVPRSASAPHGDASIAGDSELDFQLKNTEQVTPQHLCFMVLDSWVYLWDTTIGFGCYFLLVIGQHFSIQWGPT